MVTSAHGTTDNTDSIIQKVQEYMSWTYRALSKDSLTTEHT